MIESAVTNSCACYNNLTSSNHTEVLSSDPKLVAYSQIAVAVNFYLNYILLHLLCFLGVVGNTLNIIILWHHGFSDTTNIVLTSLSFTDLVFSITQCLCRVYNIVALWDPVAAYSLYSYYATYLSNINQISLALSILQVALISIERFIAVWFPFHVSRLLTTKRMKCILVFLYAYTILLTAPDNFIISLEWLVIPFTNTTYAQFRFTEFFYNNRNNIIVYSSYIRNNLIGTVPLAVVLLSTCMIIIKMSMASKNLKKMSTSKKVKETKMVKMLLVVCIIFILVLVPTTVLDPVSLILADMFTQDELVIMECVKGILYQISASANFIIYVSMSSKFAKTYRELFCWKRCFVNVLSDSNI
ncbi:thyrotropin-releasing hormone receptor-like [Physella acuta]|uniref:thyrotropin-releasing hormone receptor-like n=1 Tax=Physella acuta TaxID=109671 RepID=UPI0027DE374F|nr:thyrotropin-releasing hormone receptor-like [Physella acuta]